MFTAADPPSMVEPSQYGDLVTHEAHRFYALRSPNTPGTKSLCQVNGRGSGRTADLGASPDRQFPPTTRASRVGYKLTQPIGRFKGASRPICPEACAVRVKQWRKRWLWLTFTLFKRPCLSMTQLKIGFTLARSL